MTAIIIGPDSITNQVFVAIDDGMYLEVGVKNLLEYLSAGDDGIFESRKSWRSFIFGNFAENAERGSYWHEGECKESTVKRWCYPLEQYKGRFVQKVGKGRYCWVNPEDLDFKFTFDTNFYYRNGDMMLPASAEILVTATFKED